MQLSKKQITCFELFAPFLKSTLILSILKEKMAPVAYIFPKLQSGNDVDR